MIATGDGNALICYHTRRSDGVRVGDQSLIPQQLRASAREGGDPQIWKTKLLFSSGSRLCYPPTRPQGRQLQRTIYFGIVPTYGARCWLSSVAIVPGSSSLQPYQYDNSASKERGSRTGIGHRSGKRERRIESRRRVTTHDVGSDSRPVWVKICIADPGLKIGNERSTGNDGPL
jgi:hypothetical protein